MEISIEQIAKIMDTSIIEPNASEEEVVSFINDMKKYPFAAIAVDLYYLPLAVKLLKDTSIDVCATISYPLGGLPTPVKIKQVKWAVENGADEMDVAMNLCAFKSRDFDALRREMESIVEIAGDRVVKIIPMTAKLTPEEIKLACEIIKEAGVKFIKTNSGFGLNTPVEHVKFIKDEFGDSLRVMVAGGVRNAEIAFSMLEAGVDRIATSTPLDVFNTLKEAQTKLGEERVEKIAKRLEKLIKEVPKRRGYE
ncbi:MAG: deoxyribose-phosphate aldolase [Candidatus Asgardarchaeia archaeon]